MNVHQRRKTHIKGNMASPKKNISNFPVLDFKVKYPKENSKIRSQENAMKCQENIDRQYK